MRIIGWRFAEIVWKWQFYCKMMSLWNKRTVSRLVISYIKPLNRNRREEIITEIRTAASPGFDYFFLVVLSAAIATLGLINNSPAVIIGAMVVAPLMSPILGVASVRSPRMGN